MTITSITLGGGCFWCTEAVFQRVRGVRHVESGYCNGVNDTRPSYEQVCRGDTGFNEVTVRGDYDRNIVTEVLHLTRYWPAEDYHQNYFVNNPDQGYCTFVVAPKVRKAGQHFSEWLKP